MALPTVNFLHAAAIRPSTSYFENVLFTSKAGPRDSRIFFLIVGLQQLLLSTVNIA